MRLTEPIEVEGLFWLPGQIDTQLHGVLKITESGEITVDLAGTFGSPLVTPREFRRPAGPNEGESSPDPGRVLGNLRKGGLITLDRCLRNRSNFSLPSRLSTSTISAELAFVGAGYEEGEEALFSEFSFSVEGLDDWLTLSGIGVEFEQDTENSKGSIRFDTPHDIALLLASDTEMRFRFGLTFSRITAPLTEATVRQSASVLVKLKEPRPIKHFSSLAYKFCNFMTFALDQAVSIESMTGYLEQDTADERNRRFPIKVYGQFGPWPERKPRIRWHTALFLYPQVASNLEEIMGRWFESYESFESAFNLYFATRAQPSQFLDAKILWLTQALETLHRRSSEETEMPDEEFRDLVESLKQHCPPTRLRWLLDRLRYDNELSFRNRIRRLLNPVEKWFGDEGERKAFVRRVSDTRNYLTHYDESSTPNRATGGGELFELYEKLEALFQLHVLLLLGFDDSAIQAAVHRNRALGRKLEFRDG